MFKTIFVYLTLVLKIVSKINVYYWIRNTVWNIINLVKNLNFLYSYLPSYQECLKDNLLKTFLYSKHNVFNILQAKIIFVL